MAASQPNDEQIISKGEFARLIGVSPARVSQYIAAGTIDAAALVGEGRSARVRVHLAAHQVASRLHVGQRLSSNGLMNRASLVAAGDVAMPAIGAPPSDQSVQSVADQIQIERLAFERRKNRTAEIDEAERLGRLVPLADFNREVSRAAQEAVNVFTGMVPDIANAFAAEHGVPQRDGMHLIRRVMNEKRAAAALMHRARAAELPVTVDGTI